MSSAHIRRPDLNLLAALDVLLEERNVTRAAARLGLTQSATSRLLGRLRATFDDPLFVRTSRGLSPTRRALEIAAPLRQVMHDVERLVLEQPGFDARTARRRFRIAALDYAELVLLAPLVASLERDAPFVDVELRQPSPGNDRDLEAGRLDLLVAPRQSSGPGIVWSPLFDDGYTCLVWKGHRLPQLTAARFAELEHVLIAPREREGGVVDEVLARRGVARRVAVQVPTFLVLPYVLVGTRRIATVPVRLATHLARVHPLRIVSPPIPIPGFTMCQAWHEIHRGDPAHRWLRAHIAEAAAALRRPTAGR
ncbi:MAG TPA: LysR family transcriptional regulator [Myxococcota bacterium]|nr:LysR family transcriptional regulator [Myxococcota bacterium]